MWKNFQSLNPNQIARVYHRQLLREAAVAEEFLNKGDLLKQYMSTLSRLVVDGEHNHIIEYHFANRLQDVIAVILDEDRPIVLDAGCGLGTESLLFGLLGAEVLAVDIHPTRMEVAKRRKKWYQCNVYANLRLRFIQRDIIQFLTEIAEDKMDCRPNIIWLSEAISHIYPPERFLSLAHSVLQPNGKIVISESNPLNVVIRVMNWKERMARYKNITKHNRKQFERGDIFLYPWRFQDPHTNKEVNICNEKLWTPQQFKVMLQSVGFSVERINIYRFIPDILMTKQSLRFWSHVELCIRQIPFISLMGIRQIIIASKQE